MFADAERGGLYARIGACWHGGGYWDGSQAVALTPTSAAVKKSFVCVGIDPRSNAYVTARTVDRDLAYPLPPDDCAAVLASQPTVFWAGAVELANGATSIDPRRIIDLRFWRAPVMGGASPLMAGLAGLVPPPPANSGDRFLRGDGTWQAISGGSGGGNAIYPRRATMWHDESTVLSGNDLRHYLDPNAQLYNTRTNQDPAANGDSFSNGFLLAAGNYTLSLLGSTGAVFGKVDWYVDDALQISGQDWYSAATARNVVKRAPIGVAADGWHTLKGVVNGKHASSTGFYITLTKLWIMAEGE